MGVLGKRYIMHLFIVQLFGCLGWLCNVALAQLELSESVTGSINNFPDIGIAFIGNLAIFVTSLLRGRLDLEMGARDVLATLRGPKLYDINKGFGLTTCEASEDRFREASVVMLSFNTPNSSMKQFMKYICNAYKVHSILLQCFPLKSKSSELLPGICNHSHDDNKKCECIVFWNVEEIIMMLARRMPRKLKRLSDSLCLLPCPHCRDKGCHGCDQGQFVEEIAESGRKILTEDDMGSKIVKDIFDYVSQKSMEDHSCICIPLSPSGYDYWTKLLTRSFGVTGNAHLDYSTDFFLVPRLTEVFLNLVLTFWFRVDGFSSSLVARRAIKDYVVDSKGSGFGANAFLIETMTTNQNDCQVLKFRPTILGIKTFSYMVGSFNLFCSISWVVLVACPGGFGKWYDTYSKPPSKWRVVVIMIAIGIALGMDSLHLYLSRFSDSKEIGSQIKSTEPNVEVDSKQSTDPIVKADSEKPTKPTEATVESTAKVDSKEPTEQIIKDDSKEPTQSRDEGDSKEPTDSKVPIKQADPTIKLKWFHPIVKIWLHLKERILKMAWFHCAVTGLEKAWLRLKAWFHRAVTILEKVWLRLKAWFRPAVTVVEKVWLRLKPWFHPAVTVLKRVWLRLQAWFRSTTTVLKIFFFRPRGVVCVVMVLEIACILSGTIVLIFHMKFFGRWVFGRWLYSALQVLVWIKWIAGSYLLGEYPPEYDSQYDYDNGIIVYSSAFFLNCILAGVRGDWHYSLSTNN